MTRLSITTLLGSSLLLLTTFTHGAAIGYPHTAELAASKGLITDLQLSTNPIPPISDSENDIDIASSNLVRRFFQHGQIEGWIREALIEDPNLELNPEYLDSELAKYVEPVRQELKQNEKLELRDQDNNKSNPLVRRFFQHGEIEDMIRQALTQDPDLELDPQYFDSKFADYVEVIRQELASEKKLELREASGEHELDRRFFKPGEIDGMIKEALREGPGLQLNPIYADLEPFIEEVRKELAGEQEKTDHEKLNLREDGA